MRFFKRKNRRDTKLLYTFQQPRNDPPAEAIQSTVTNFRVKTNVYGDRDDVRCPECGKVNRLTHGDRILCGCDTCIETYGNSMVYWHQSIKYKPPKQYARLDPDDLRPTIREQLTITDDIRHAYETHPAVRDAIDELEVLIKLHENIDTTE